MSKASDTLPAVVTRSKGSIDPFTEWCRDELFTADMVAAAALLDRACDLYLVRVFRELKLDALLRTPKCPKELCGSLGFVSTGCVALDAMLYRLASRGLCVETVRGGDKDRFLAASRQDDPEEELAEVRQRIAALGCDYLAALDFLEFGADHFIEGLRDDPDLLDRILSGRDPDRAEMWNRATNADPLQDVHGKMGAAAISRLFEGGTILEVGGGTGNGIRHLFGQLEADGKLGLIDRYVFSDISQRFVLETRHEIRRAYPTVSTEWRFLDINQPFESQKVQPASCDLIYGVNSAHVARDIVAFLEECRRALRPGGKVLFAERIRMDAREMAPRELTLNLSIYHRTAAIHHAEYRPTHCYLTPENWRKVLELAGFARCEILPDLEALAETLPNPYAAIVVGHKE